MSQARKYASAAHRQAAYRLRRSQAGLAQLRERGLPALSPIPTMPGAARWKAALVHAEHLLSTVSEEMQGYFDDRSEVWQESDRGEEHEERAAAVDEVLDALRDLMS